jgi:hypothetical protein
MRVGLEVLTAATMRSEVATPCSSIEVHRRFGGTYRHNFRGRNHETNTFDKFFLLVSFLAYSSTSMMENIRSSETSIDLYRTTRYYNTDDRTVREYMKSMKLLRRCMYRDVRPYSVERYRHFGGTCCLRI